MFVLMPLHKIDNDLVTFLGNNLKQNPGNTELVLQVMDEEAQMITKLKTLGKSIELNDELINYLKADESFRCSLDIIS
jgi:hypothetical protein